MLGGAYMIAANKGQRTVSFRVNRQYWIADFLVEMVSSVDEDVRLVFERLSG